jgi:hypothetical protein
MIMNAIRQFIEVIDNSINVTLPEGFSAKRVEIIILPSDNDVQISKETQNLLDKRLDNYLKNPEKVSDFDEFIQEMKNDL